MTLPGRHNSTLGRAYLMAGGVIGFYGVTLLLLPHHPVDLAGFLTYSVQTLLLFICLAVFKHEPTRNRRFVFLNFAILFATAPIAHLYNFVGTVIPAEWFYSDTRFSRFLINQYVFRGAYFLFIAVALGYLAIDLVLREQRVMTKYIVTIGIVAMFFGVYYYPFIRDPLYLHRTADVQEWKVLDQAFSSVKQRTGIDPTAEQLAALPSVRAAFDAMEVTNEPARVTELYPYLFADNWKILVFKPLHLNQIYMSILSIGFVILFFGYQFLKDPPQGAYIEKVMFLFLAFCTLEAFHAYMATSIIEWQALKHFTILGIYFSVVILGLVAIIFSLRLHFITSAKGEFYEQELAESPGRITRWRDLLDDLVIEKFFNRKVILGRLLVDPTRR